ncbi:MAG: PAS domain S-box protein [Deltaproteobacteria bacterium]|nr:PAS domain S-box protein [Deltaproteobacteria bacterium]
MRKTTHYMLLNVLIVTIGMAITAIFFLGQMRAEAENRVKSAQENHLRTFWELLNSKGGEFRISNGKMFVGDQHINDKNDLPDKIKTLFGGTATIFMGDTRVSTNVLKADGSRALGTKLTGEAYEALFHQGKPYRGEADILGVPYYTAYDPIRDRSGTIIGALYVGIKKSDFFATYDAVRVKAIVVALLLMTLFAFLAILILRQERLATKAIEHSEHKYRLLFSRMLNGFSFHEMLYDQNAAACDYRFLEINPAFEKITGLSEKDIVGKTIREVLAGSVEDWIRIYEPVARHGQSLRFERYSPELGKHFEIIAFSPEQNKFATIFSDITDRKVAEENLRANEEKNRKLSMEFRALLEAIPDAVILYSPDLKIRWANRNACRSLGKEPDVVLNQSCFAIWHHKNEPCLVCPVQRSFQSGTNESEEMTFSDGTIRDVHAAPVFDEQGAVIGVVGITRDITHHRKMETHLNHLQKMDAIGHLAGGIAHDFNNILTAISGYGHLLQLKTASDSPTRKYVDNIMLASERAADLTKNLLAISRKQAFHPKPADLNEIITDLDALLSRLIREDIEIRREIHPFSLPVMADVGQMEQVLINLVTNARDAMKNGGTIYLRSLPFHLENEFVEAFGFGTPGNYAAFSITDTGMGIDEKTRERIFEPFFTTKEKGKGTGLGLAIVYGIIKQHNGYITVDSEPGQGTTFTVYLPLAKDETRPVDTPEEQTSYPGSEVVLLAEDEEELRSLFRSVLEENGYSVLEAANGEEAIDTFLTHKDSIELLILDVIMPRRNAREVYDAVKRESPGMKFLFVSGYGQETIHESGIQGENVTILTKPASLPRFLKAVRVVLDG